MSVYCRHEAAGSTAALGRQVREALGGIESVAQALDLASGAASPSPEQEEAAALLRSAWRLREALVPAEPARGVGEPGCVAGGQAGVESGGIPSGRGRAAAEPGHVSARPALG
jgi:hypothetical protein